MSTDPTAPATKQDIALLMNEIGKLYSANEGWKEDLTEKMEAWKEEVKEHFDVVAENIKHDFRGAFSDKLAQHEDRIVRLETEAGLRAA